MKITLSGGAVVTLPEEEVSRLEEEYAAWMEPGKPYGEFGFNKGSVQTRLRFDQIALRVQEPKSMSAPNFAKAGPKTQ